MYIVKSLLEANKNLINIRALVLNLQDFEDNSLYEILKTIDVFRESLCNLSIYQAKHSKGSNILSASNGSLETGLVLLLLRLILSVFENPLKSTKQSMLLFRKRAGCIIESLQLELDTHNVFNHALEVSLRSKID